MLKGFASEVFDSQMVFRQILNAMANPGTIMDIGIALCSPESLHRASGAILLTLLDFETLLWSDLGNNSKAVKWIKFHTGTPYTNIKDKSLFALCTDYDNLEDPEFFNQGTIESPHQSTTLIIQTKGIDNRESIRLTGPGIKAQAFLRVQGVKELFLDQRAEIFKNYPLGIDMIFVCGSTFAAIPRTSRVEIL